MTRRSGFGRCPGQRSRRAGPRPIFASCRMNDDCPRRTRPLRDIGPIMGGPGGAGCGALSSERMSDCSAIPDDRAPGCTRFAQASRDAAPRFPLPARNTARGTRHAWRAVCRGPGDRERSVASLAIRAPSSKRGARRPPMPGGGAFVACTLTARRTQDRLRAAPAVTTKI